MTGGFVNEELRCLYEINREMYAEWLTRPELEYLSPEELRCPYLYDGGP